MVTYAHIRNIISVMVVVFVNLYLKQSFLIEYNNISSRRFINKNNSIVKSE